MPTMALGAWKEATECLTDDDDKDDVYFKKLQREGVTKSNPTQKMRPAKGIRESTYK
jgi:hypothetical protein